MQSSAGLRFVVDCVKLVDLMLRPMVLVRRLVVNLVGACMLSSMAPGSPVVVVKLSGSRSVLVVGAVAVAGFVAASIVVLE